MEPPRLTADSQYKQWTVQWSLAVGSSVGSEFAWSRRGQCSGVWLLVQALAASLAVDSVVGAQRVCLEHLWTVQAVAVEE